MSKIGFTSGQLQGTKPVTTDNKSNSNNSTGNTYKDLKLLHGTDKIDYRK